MLPNRLAIEKAQMPWHGHSHKVPRLGIVAMGHHRDMNPCRHLLVDRDGVLNRERPGVVVRTLSQWQWEPSAPDALRLAARHKVAVSVVTNQSAVARGRLARYQLEDLHRWLAEQIRDLGADLVGIFACTHDPTDGCGCRKPRPGLLVEAMETSGIPADETVLVGDDLRDIEAAAAAGVRSVLVRTGKGPTVEKLLEDRLKSLDGAALVDGTAVVDDLQAAVSHLIA